MSLPSGLVDGPPVKSKTLIAAFEKELAYLNSYVRKNKHEDRFIQKGYAHAQYTAFRKKLSACGFEPITSFFDH